MKPITLPDDLYLHETESLEWWYFSGHFHNTQQPLAFHVALFHLNLARFRELGKIPLQWLFSKDHFIAHISLVDAKANTFYYSLRRHNGQLDRANDRAQIRVGDCSIRLGLTSYDISCVTNSIQLEMRLDSLKVPILHGTQGVVRRDRHSTSAHLSCSRLKIRGTIKQKDHTHHIQGTGWFDREFGLPKFHKQFHGWEWVCIQLHDNQEFMIELIHDDRRALTPESTLTWIQRDGSHRVYTKQEFSMNACRTWQSPQTGNIYPVEWLLESEVLALRLSLRPLLDHQELDTRGVSRLCYWEGAASVRGVFQKTEVTGQAYLELVGYDGLPKATRFWQYLRDEFHAWHLGYDRAIKGS